MWGAIQALVFFILTWAFWYMNTRGMAKKRSTCSAGFFSQILYSLLNYLTCGLYGIYHYFETPCHSDR